MQEKRLQFSGKCQTLDAWSKETGISKGNIVSRLHQGWSVERTLSEPVVGPATLTLKGETKTISEWAKIKGLNAETIRVRIKQGWSEERALTTPSRCRNGRRKHK